MFPHGLFESNQPRAAPLILSDFALPGEPNPGKVAFSGVNSLGKVAEYPHFSLGKVAYLWYFSFGKVAKPRNYYA